MPELDGARGIAVIMVLLVHFFTFSMVDRSWTGLPRLVMHAATPGWLGVDLFFCLSGFLITGILLDSRSDPHYFRNFYARRALRILPLYCVVLAILALFYRGSGSFVVLGLFMSLNLGEIFGIAFVSGGVALWSLAVEEHFYLIWPWVARYLRPATLAAVCVAICALEPIVRATFWTPLRDVYFYSWFRFDGLAWGALIAIFVRWSGANRTSGLRLAGVLIVAAIVIIAIGAPLGLLHRGNRVGAALQFTPFEMAFAGVVLTLVTLSGSPATALFRSRALTIWGDLSYCIYVTHVIVVEAVDHVYSRFADLHAAMGQFSFIVVRAAVTTALCFAIALVSRRFFELPILRLKRYFAHS
jgi:peptidoglycan/LPS O-acetylase OafA/YrhL